MVIYVNGEQKAITAGTITALLSELGISPLGIAVEQNLAIVPKSRYEATPLTDGDRIEIIQFIGGG